MSKMSMKTFWLIWTPSEEWTWTSANVGHTVHLHASPLHVVQLLTSRSGYGWIFGPFNDIAELFDMERYKAQIISSQLCKNELGSDCGISLQVRRTLEISPIRYLTRAAIDEYILQVLKVAFKSNYVIDWEQNLCVVVDNVKMEKSPQVLNWKNVTNSWQNPCSYGKVTFCSVCDDNFRFLQLPCNV